jgi:hypothetical protein
VAGRILKRRAGLAVAVAVPAFALAGCTSTIDPSSAENFVKNYFTSHGVKVESVSCPDNVDEKAGNSFTCKLTASTSAGTQTGTVTIHQTDSSGHVTFGPSDVHVTSGG